MAAFVTHAAASWVTGRQLTIRGINASPLQPYAPSQHSVSTPCAVLDAARPQSIIPTADAPLASIEGETSPADDDIAWDSLRSILPFKTLRTITKPGQYLGNEFGARHKSWEKAAIRFCLAYPDLYSIGMSSTGHVILYSCLNDDPQLLCDRAYLPGPDMQDALQKHQCSLFAVESHRPLNEFDIVGMSLSYELGATNCIKVLQLSNIPFTWAERDSEAPIFAHGSPLIFAGGITVTANPEPYADIFDFFSIGDGEDMLPEIGRTVATILKEDPLITRHDLLLQLAQTVSGVYVPRFYTPDSNGAVRPIRPDVPAKIQKRNSIPEPWRATALVPVNDPVHDRLTVEIRRGCTRGCRFCLPGMVQRPARDVSPEDVVKTVINGVRETGYNEFSLLSLSCSDWLSLPSVGIQLKNALKDQEESISLSLGSQRVDRFDENIAKLVGGLRHGGLTFAPEAGTQRLRDVINKGLTNEDLARGVKLAYDSGYQNVKLYFMINLPTETDEDVMGIADTIKWLQRICKGKGRKRLSVNVTISTFTPKAWTPFQWATTSIDEVKRKQKLLMKALTKSRDVKFSFTDPMLSSMEDFIGRGDRRIGQVVIRAHELGAGMDAWWEKMGDAYNAWCQAIREAGLEWKYRQTERGEWNIAEMKSETIRGARGWFDIVRKENLDRRSLFPKSAENSTTAAAVSMTYTQSPLDRPLPWDHIDVGLDKGWLRDELMRALTENLTPDCAFHECSTCGVCGDELGNNITIEAPPVPEYKGVFRPSTDKKQRFRIALRKRGSFALASHLDLTRMLDRLLRKASIPMSYAGRYSPHPRMTVAAALPFGASADEEIVEFVLRDEMSEGEFRSRLVKHLPPGLSLVWSRTVPLKAPKASALMVSAHYVIAVEFDGQDVISWDSVVSRVLSSESVLVEKMSKGGQKSMRDLRKMLYEMRLAAPDEAAPILEHVGVSDWPPNTGVLFCNTELLNTGALSPDGVVNLINIVMESTDFQLLHCHRRRIVLQEAISSLNPDRVEDIELDEDGTLKMETSGSDFL